ncbi:hypothetical protein AMS68_000289 [Peltaster fructicola]|uniref:PH-response regulator protein palH/RIM21 n=1 Tax=Peltaster fructicola TaxID=286661 RepID=A0A6H0XJ79_9PEZI|nr:hypothetical protein AMS68_000289 [Peltaster fructicola]
MTPSTALVERQLYNLPTTSTSISIPHCTPFTLPAGGVITLPNATFTLTDDALFQPQCSGDDFAISADGSPAAIEDLRDPFYASTTPQVYVVAATTVIAWILVLMLVITPRTSFFGASGVQAGFNSGHSFIGGSARGGSMGLIGVGSRPWLQKAAALTVAISLTIATADTFRVAQQQYNIGYMDATAMREAVIGSRELRITRVISDVFVWLAQVQTLIRLFPRHREKVLIKWIGFGLIICDTTFSCLNSFLVNSNRAPKQFVDAIPALSYLFELALGLLYAAWVIYYAVTKRRYAFYHTKMKSILLISVLSLVAILTPVVFFITDVSNSGVASWGDYFRWVGAAAASVVVWEWVERIEAIERDEKKDGILGREIYDDDDLLGDMPNDNVVWTSNRRGGGGGGYRKSDQLEAGTLLNEKSSPEQSQDHDLSRIAARDHVTQDALIHTPRRRSTRVTGGLSVPAPVASPISRTETSSAASTVYVVRSEPAADVPQPIRRRPETTRANPRQQFQRMNSDNHAKTPDIVEESDEEPTTQPTQGGWLAVNNPFKRKRALPPAEVQKAQRAAMPNSELAHDAKPKHNFSKWDIKNRFGVLAADASDLIWQKVGKDGTEQRNGSEGNIIVIPAQPRGSGRTWSPAVLETGQTGRPPAPMRHGSDQSGSSSLVIETHQHEQSNGRSSRHA